DLLPALRVHLRGRASLYRIKHFFRSGVSIFTSFLATPYEGKMFVRTGLLLAMLMAPAAQAGVAVFVHVDTTTITATTGWLDFQFNPGSVSWQDAYAEISAYASDGSLLVSASPLSPDIIGDVSGTLPATMTLHNAGGLNDYFQRITFGGYVNFTLTLLGEALDSPDGGV